MGQQTTRKDDFSFEFSWHCSKFNGVDIDQAQNYNHIHCASYIDKIIQHHNWQNLMTCTPPTPIQADNKYQADIQFS